MPTENESEYSLSGRITDRNGAPFPSLTARAFYPDPTNPSNPVGRPAITDADGRYTVVFNEEEYRLFGKETGGIDLFVRAFLRDRLVGQSAVSRGAGRRTVIDLQIKIARPLPEEPSALVRGTVRDARGAPVAGLAVVAYDRDLRKAEELGRSTTQADGSYVVEYQLTAPRRREIGTADLMVRAFTDRDQQVAQSEILFNAPREAEIDLVADAADWIPTSLFERIDEAVKPLLGEVQVAELDQTDRVDDLTFISGETGFDIVAIGRFALAHRLEADKTPAIFWFAALAGTGYAHVTGQPLADQLSKAVRSVGSAGVAELHDLILRAMDAHEIVRRDDDTIDGWVSAARARVADAILDDDPENTELARAVLDDAGIDDLGKRERAAVLIARAPAFDGVLTKTLREAAGLDDKEIERARTSFTVIEIAGGDANAAAFARKRFAVERPEDIRRLAKASPDEWAEMIGDGVRQGKVTAPLAVAERHLGLPEKGAELYGRALGRKFAAAYPTAALTGALERGTDRGQFHGIRQPERLGGFLEAHPNLELVNTRLDRFLDEEVSDEWRDAARDPEFRTEIKALQRVFKLAPSAGLTDAMLADDVHSAQMAYRMGETAFVRRYSDAAEGGPLEARQVWRRAADTHAAVLSIVGELKAYDGEGMPLVLKLDSEALEKFPNWRNLFQGGDLCDCAHCRSVLSPAAYFADILMFLKDRHTTDATADLKTFLFRRRPDLAYLELNCDNSLVPLPYVDVVNEVLESAIAGETSDAELAGLQNLPADPSDRADAVSAAVAAVGLELGSDAHVIAAPLLGADQWITHGTRLTVRLFKKGGANFFARIAPNTKVPAAELRAFPQYVDPAAYAALAAAKRLPGLPFDLPNTEVRAGFAKIRSDRAGLMRTLRTGVAPADPSDAEIAAVHLGISVNGGAPTDEFRLITVANTIDSHLQEVWGATGAGWIDDVANVRTFLNLTKLTYDELNRLLDLSFVDPDGDLSIEHLDATCDLDQKRIHGLDDDTLDRMHRFLRLWRKLGGWKLFELDLAIEAAQIGGGDLDGDFLVRLSAFERLRHRLGRGATVERVLALFQPLGTASHFTEPFEPRRRGLYDELFQNPRLMHPVDPTFAIDPATGDTPNGGSIAAGKAVIMAATRVTEADLDRLIGLTRASDDTLYIDDALTLAHLTFLWRHAWLAKRLKISITGWATLLKLYAVDRETFGDPVNALAMVEDLDRVERGALDVDEVDWVLTANPDAKASADVSKEAAYLSVLRGQLQAVRAEFDPAQYPFLVVPQPSEEPALTELLTDLLQTFGRSEAGIDLFQGALRGQAVAIAPVEGLPAGFEFPAVITDQMAIRVNATGSELQFTGSMAVAQRTTLLNSGAIPQPVRDLPSYQEAVQALFETPRLAVKFFRPTFVTPLDALPDGVDFAALANPELQAKVAFDAEVRTLGFAGIMTLAERRLLEDLSADGAYRAALTALYDQPRNLVAPDPRVWVTLDDLAEPLDDPANLRAHLALAIVPALAWLTSARSEEVVITSGGAALEVDADLTRRILTHDDRQAKTFLRYLVEDFAATTGIIDPATQPLAIDLWMLALRTALLAKAWKLDTTDWDRLLDLTPEAQLLDLETLPVNATGAAASMARFVRTERLLLVRESIAEAQGTLLDVLRDLKTGAIADVAAFASAAEQLDDRLVAADMAELAGAPDMVFPDSLYLAETWDRFLEGFGYMRALAAGAATARRFAKAAMTADDARAMNMLLQGKYGESTWQTLGGEIQDVLRDRKRDALAAYLLTQPEPADNPSGKWENAADLYGYFLLDVEMSSCQLTSRLVQASGSVQLFVQRCLMGLEPEVEANAEGPDGDSAWRWWDWMRKYRVWEANRKVFLFPENWIEPELKRDRSSFFKDLEAEVQQKEINRDNVETAFIAYLQKLNGVANLEIAGFYQEDDGDDTILHVFGRNTATEPHLYYYRTFDYRQWSPWSKVDLEIQGDYLIPLVVAKRLYLFWPIFSEVPDEAGNASVLYPQDNDQPIPLQRAMKRLKLQLAVSDFRQGEWTPKRISKDFAQSGTYSRDIVKRHYVFRAIDRSDVDGRVGISFSGHSVGVDGERYAFLNGTFDITGCSGVPELGNSLGSLVTAIRPEIPSVGDDPKFGGWIEERSRQDKPENDFTLIGSGPVLESFYSRLLRETPGLFRDMPSWQLSYFDKLGIGLSQSMSLVGFEPRAGGAGQFLPFFYNDRRRTFFVEPQLRQRTPRGEDPIYYNYNDAKRFARQLETLFKGFVSQLVDSMDLDAIPAAERLELERRLKLTYGIEAAPPYTNEFTGELLVRWFMGFFKGLIGYFAAQVFRTSRWRFATHYHPFVCDFLGQVYHPLKGVPGLMSRQTQLLESPYRFFDTYRPTAAVVEPSPLPGDLHSPAYPKEDVDFTPDGAYAPYNWELFYHAPLLIGNALSRNQRFEEARTWYHYIFNPIGIEGPSPGGAPTSRYWITKPFFQMATQDYVAQRIDTIMRLISGDTGAPGFSDKAQKALEDQVRDWRENPFEPHRIANYRQVAYQKTVVMKYLDNLVAWGDHLFRQDSMESINEATQLYILAAEILGPRPRKVSPAARPVDRTFAELEGDLDAFSNALIEVENLIPAIAPQVSGDPAVNLGGAPPLPMLYFCIPQNDKLVGYWDTIADRLHKIRNCMDIDGVKRQLALFEPEIDPGALVKAVAGGAGIAGALADLNAPLPPYRFRVALQQANTLCGDLKGLGSSLLSALEKKDVEELALLRQGNELKLLNAVVAVLDERISEAKQQVDALEKSKAMAKFRQSYYDGRDFMNAGEIVATTLNSASILIDIPVSVGYITAGVLKLIPNFLIGASGFGGSPHATAESGGQAFGDAAQFAVQGLAHIARNLDKIATLSSTLGGYQRRQDDWDFQRDLAERETEQLDHSIEAAGLRLKAAEKERQNQLLQIENSTAIDDFMRTKYTATELYQWQITQISGVFMRSFQLAYDLAKQCERSMRFELGLEQTSILQSGHWDSLRKGLLSGERLQHDLRRLESTYNERNRRELELEKHVSLAALDPIALTRLRETGRCEFRLTEDIYDLDWPGHYFRRIKSVSLTVPCVVGPHTTLACTLRLTRNSIRNNTSDGDAGYPRNVDDAGMPASDSRFIENPVPVKAIAVSRGQDDDGMFILDFNDTRYLPFEGAGAISDWSLELFNDADDPEFGRALRQFDYGTITDAVLHVKYTAREDAGPFKAAAIQNLRDGFAEEAAIPVLRAFDIRHEFPTEWHRFLFPSDPATGNVLTLPIRRGLFRYLGVDETLKVNAIWVMARCANGGDYTVRLSPPLPSVPAGADVLTLAQLASYGDLHVAERIATDAFDVEIGSDAAPVDWRLEMTRPGGGALQTDAATGATEVTELMLVVGYRFA